MNLNQSVQRAKVKKMGILVHTVIVIISEVDENEEPPAPPVLKRTKGVSKNEKAVAKMNKYIAKKVAQSQYPGHLYL